MTDIRSVGVQLALLEALERQSKIESLIEGDIVKYVIPIRDGKPGLDGRDGIDGIDGKDGRDGVDGLPGKDGLDGRSGAVGPKGPRGEKGEHGMPGPRGLTGLRGEPGPRGESGPQGTDGTSITNIHFIDDDLLITLSDGREFRGRVKGNSGESQVLFGIGGSIGPPVRSMEYTGDELVLHMAKRRTTRVSLAQPVQVLTANGALAIDYSVGRIVRLTLTGNSSLAVNNWPANSTGQLTLEVINSGAFNITSWPAGTLWPGGTPPTITPSGRDLFALVTTDSGSTIYGNTAGTAFA